MLIICFLCSTVTETKSCVRRNLFDCDQEKVDSIMASLHQVLCVASDICPSAITVPPVVDDDPPSCIDPAVVSDDASCSPRDALRCVKSLSIAARDPLKDWDSVCL